MTQVDYLLDIGQNFFEVGFVLISALAIAFFLKRFGVPAVLGLIIGGLSINLLMLLIGQNNQELVFNTDFKTLKALITELALAWIGYDIGNEIDLELLRKEGKNFGIVLLGEAIGAFLLVTIGLSILFTVNESK